MPVQRGHRGQAAQQAESSSGSSGVVAASGHPTLPLFPLFDHVLLPGGFLRVTVPAGWSKSVALVQQLLQQQGGEVLVAAVPYLIASRAAPLLPAAPTTGGEDEGPSSEAGDPQLDLDRLHHTGTAARVLQLARRTASGGWTVTLEGRCRLRVRGVHLAASRPPLQGELYEADVEQLDYFTPAAGRLGGAVKHVGSHLGAAKASLAGGIAAAGSGSDSSATKEQEALSQELLKGTRRLFVLLQGEGEGREAAARVARALAQQGPARMSDVLGSLVARSLRDRLALLASMDVTARLQMVVDLLGQMLEVAEKAAAGGGSARGGGGGARRAIRGGSGVSRGLRLPGLGADEAEDDDEEEDGKRELAAVMQKLKDANPPAEVLRAAQREFKRLQRGSEQHPGYSMSLSYLETLADLPWSRLSVPKAASGPQGAPDGADEATPNQGLPPRLPLAVVRQRLDEAHYGLDKIKDRIVQYVAVQRLRGWDTRAPILCFIGPPGVGKTSLARSIAEVLGRPFQRISLGGVRDEAEIRGHRRTYIGAMPGRLIQAVRKAGVRDPLLLLDEVDKMGRDARGDPAAALLEVLDPEQNGSFVDTYLGLPFDLSSSLFVATANRSSDIPAPLLDRLEVVQLGGYTLDEKVHIAERHLIPRLLADHGLHQGQLVFPPGAVRTIIEGYTGEAGVRSLSRCLAAVCRHVAVQVVQYQEQDPEQDHSGHSGAGDADGGLPLLGGGEGRGAGSGGDPHVPLPLPPLQQASAAAGGGMPGPILASLSREGSSQARQAGGSSSGGSRSGSGGGSGGLQLPGDGPLVGASSVRLWANLLPLAGLERDGSASMTGIAAVSHATGGYPWQQLSEPVHSSSSSSGGSRVGSSAANCSCPARKQQPGWFSWLRWARHDSSAEHAGEPAAAHAPPSGGGDVAGATEAAAACACGGGCGDADCCCHVGTSRGLYASGLPSEWGEHRHAGTAADSRGWEASWRGTAGGSSAVTAHTLLCGPGSMQILRPAATSAHPRFAAPGLGTPASGAGLVAAPLPQFPQQLGAHSVLPIRAGALGLQEGAEAEGGAELSLPGQRAQHAQQQEQVVVDEELIEAVLGPRRYEGHNSAEMVATPGTAAGLVWTSVGGKVQYIECICVGEGRTGRSGQLTLTGQLGDVLEESARIALSWVRAHATGLGLPGDAACPSRKWDVHIHLPAGAVPKDGPSAGVTLAAALVSLFTGKSMRPDVAMTGELTLRGLVLPVGGIKEKLLAAQAAGMARVLVPARNMPDVQAEVPPALRQSVEVLPCQRLEDVLQGAFDPPFVLDEKPLARL